MPRQVGVSRRWLVHPWVGDLVVVTPPVAGTSTDVPLAQQVLDLLGRLELPGGKALLVEGPLGLAAAGALGDAYGPRYQVLAFKGEEDCWYWVAKSDDPRYPVGSALPTGCYRSSDRPPGLR
jgi:hypothetical protein